jgi:hypothetical protein
VTQPLLRQLYDAYSFSVIPKVGALVANDEASYQYLVESIRLFPDQVRIPTIVQRERCHCTGVQPAFCFAAGLYRHSALEVHCHAFQCPEGAGGLEHGVGLVMGNGCVSSAGCGTSAVLFQLDCCFLGSSWSNLIPAAPASP